MTIQSRWWCLANIDTNVPWIPFIVIWHKLVYAIHSSRRCIYMQKWFRKIITLTMDFPTQPRKNPYDYVGPCCNLIRPWPFFGLMNTEPMPAFIQWLHTPGHCSSEFMYLHHAGGTVHLGSVTEDDLVMSCAMQEGCVQVILHPIQDAAGDCKWLLKVHLDHMCHIRFK